MPWTETLEYSSDAMADVWMAQIWKENDPIPWSYIYLLEPGTFPTYRRALRRLAKESFIRRGVLPPKATT